MSYAADVGFTLTADNFDDLTQQIKTLVQGRSVNRVSIYQTDERAANWGQEASARATDEKAAASAVEQAKAATKAKAAKAPPTEKAKVAEAVAAEPPFDPDPRQDAAAPAPAPAAPAAPATAKGPSHADLISELRAILTAHKDRSAVNAFIRGKGYSSVSETGIPADALPALIAEARVTFS